MQQGEFKLDASTAYLTRLVEEIKPDLLHLNQVCYGNLPVRVPRVEVAHGDLISWWQAVHGHEPKQSPRLRWYRRVVTQGVPKASGPVTPTTCRPETNRDSP